MPVSNFPGGFPNGLTVLGLPVLNFPSGTVFWVDSGAGSNSYGGTFDKPFSTLDFAIGRCTANHGDEIHLKPGHAETLTAASDIDFDIAGITVIGHGYGTNLPSFTYGSANTASMVIDVAGTTLYNIRFVANFLSVATLIDVAAVAGTGVYNCKFEDTSSTLNWVKCIDFADGASDIHIVGNKAIGTGVTSGAFVNQAGADTDDVEYSGNVVTYQAVMTVEQAAFHVAGGLQNLRMFNNYVTNQEADASPDGGGLFTTGQTDNTGVVAFNYLGHLDEAWAATEDPFEALGCSLFECQAADASKDVSGNYTPVVDAAT